MKRILACVLIVVLALSCVGCTKKEEEGERINTFGSSDDGLYLYKNLTVQDITFYDFDTEKYDAEEYRGFLQLDIDEYNNTHEFNAPTPETNEEGTVIDTNIMKAPIEIQIVDTKDNVLEQQIRYATTFDYVEYNTSELEKRGGTKLDVGTLALVDSAVLEYSYLNQKGEEVILGELCGEGEDTSSYRYILCGFKAVLYGDGDIVAYSSNLTYDATHNCVTVPEGQTGVVIFK